MTTIRKPWTGILLLQALLVAFSFLTICNAFDEQLCASYAVKPMASDQTSVYPKFYDDYYYIAEETIFEDDDRTNEQVVQLESTYSQELEQMVISMRTADMHYWAHADGKRDDLIERVNDGPCQDSRLIDWKLAKEYLDPSSTAQDAKLVPPSHSMGWKETRMLIQPKTSVRNMPAVPYFTCSSEDDDTEISIWYFLDTDKMETTNALGTVPLMVKEYKQDKNSETIEDYFVEFTDYKKLTQAQIAKNLEIPENACGYINSPAMQQQVPTPPQQFSTMIEAGTSHAYQVKEYSLHFEYHFYDYPGKLFYYESETGYKNSPDEKYISFVVEDFNTGYSYAMSLLTGWCSAYITSGFRMGSRDANGNPKMKTPEEYWKLGNDRNRAHVGQYSNRDILTDTWRLASEPDENGKSKYVDTLYLASNKWLRSQRMFENTFYPVMVKEDTDDKYHRYNHFYEFRAFPGYHIPDVSQCFHKEDIVVGVINLYADYHKTIYPYRNEFNRAFREAILKYSGIVSAVRVAKVIALSDKEEGETRVGFKILGRVKPGNYTPAQYHELDPIPSFDAVKNVNKALDEGKFTVNLKINQGYAKLLGKAASLNYLDGADALVNFDNPYPPAPKTGYSSGAMAALGLTMLLVCMILGLLAVLFYKHYTEGGTISGVFSMNKLGSDA